MNLSEGRHSVMDIMADTGWADGIHEYLSAKLRLGLSH